MPGSGLAAADLWGACTLNLRGRVADATWRAWFEPVRPLSLDDGHLVLAVPSSVMKERLEQRHLTLLRDVASGLAGSPIVVAVHVQPSLGLLDAEPRPTAAPAATGPGGGTGQAPASTASVSRPAVTAGPEELMLNPDYTFDAFVIGGSNHFAHAAALSVAETPAKSYNPLFIYGPAGLGKTHLLHAIGHYVRQHYPNLCVRYVTTETFLNQFVDAIRYNTMNTFKRHYRECHVLLIDDVQFIENKPGVQEELFHTFNFLHGAGRQIVLSADRAPKLISTIEERLISRLEWGLITDVFPPDLETRLAILRKKAERDNAEVPGEILAYIATEVTDNIRKLEGAFNRLWAFTSLTHQPLTLELAEQVLADLVKDRQRLITPRVILDSTAEMFGFSLDELCGKSRSRPLVTARQIAMYVFRELTDFSYPAIGREFGGRDHTTVMHAVDKIKTQMAERRTTYDQVNALLALIKGSG